MVTGHLSGMHAGRISRETGVGDERLNPKKRPAPLLAPAIYSRAYCRAMATRKRSSGETM
jgi:hypothetical protein